jgi:hypothetical protein
VDLAWLTQRCDREGLRVRGGFHPTTEDDVPPLRDGRTARTVVLVGGVGPSLWPAFARSPEAADGGPDPLDRWSRRVIEDIAREAGGTPLFPFGGPPYLPFQRWAMRAEPVAPSPLGILIHPDHGLWHAYRGALAFAEPLPLPPRDERPHPCDSCSDRPCLAGCPVGAFRAGAYDVPTCIDHLDRPAGAVCMTAACLARRACPVGRQHAYGSEQAAFHMQAFRRAQVIG